MVAATDVMQCLNGYPRPASRIAKALQCTLEELYERLVELESRGMAQVRSIGGSHGKKQGWVAAPDLNYSPLLVPSRKEQEQ